MKLFILFIFSITLSKAVADCIVTDKSIHYGKIILIDSNQVVLKSECDGKEITFQWSRISSLYFTASCVGKNKPFEIHPFSSANCNSTQAFKFELFGDNNEYYARDLKYENSTITLVSFGDKVFSYPVPKMELLFKYIMYDEFCITNNKVPNLRK